MPLVVLGEIPDERRPVPPGRIQRRQEQLLDEAVAVRPAPDPARELLGVELGAAFVRDGEAIVRADLSDGFGKVSDRRRLCVKSGARSLNLCTGRRLGHVKRGHGVAVLPGFLGLGQEAHGFLDPRGDGTEALIDERLQQR